MSCFLCQFSFVSNFSCLLLVLWVVWPLSEFGSLAEMALYYSYCIPSTATCFQLLLTFMLPHAL